MKKKKSDFRPKLFHVREMMPHIFKMINDYTDTKEVHTNISNFFPAALQKGIFSRGDSNSTSLPGTSDISKS